MRDAEQLAGQLRQADLDEIALKGQEPLPTLMESLALSAAWTVDAGGPIAIFGVRKVAVEGSKPFGMVWLMGSEGVRRHRRWFLRESKRWAKRLAEGCRWTGNVIDSRNKTYIRWLQWMGYRFSAPRKDGLQTFVKDHV